MDKIEFVERRYRQIMPEPVHSWIEMPIQKLHVWIQDDVAGLVAEYVARPKFRDTASWSLQALRSQANTAARRQVDAVAEALIRHARLLRKLLRIQKVATAIEEFATPHRNDDEVVMITSAGTELLSRTSSEVSQWPIIKGQVEEISQPFWSDLVDPNDYLEPRGGWLGKKSHGETATAGEFVVAINPQLHAIGDFVFRCLIRRIEVLIEILENIDRTLYACVRSIKGRLPKELSTVAEDAARLRESKRLLHSICSLEHNPEIRDSVVILTQIYTAFHPNPDVRWLGLDDEVVATGRAVIRHRLMNIRNPELPERVAAALSDLRRLYANEPPGNTELDEAVARGGLVLVTSPRAAFWKGDSLGVNWKLHPRPWELLFELARKGRLSADVGEGHLFPDVPSSSAMHTLFGRLKRLLSPDLCKHIVPGRTARSYRLELEAGQIFILDRPN